MLAYADVRILIISPAIPWPPRRGYQLRAAHLAETMASRHEVAVVAQDVVRASTGSQARALVPAGIEIEAVSHGVATRLGGALHAVRRPIQVALHHQAALRHVVAASVARRRPDIAVLMLSRLGDVVPALDGVPLVVDFVDALAANMARRADRQPWLAPLWRWEARRMARWDRQLLARSRAGLVVAARDRLALLGEDQPDRARVPVHVMPLGMKLPASTRLRPDGPPTVVLTGNLGYFPTVEGAGWFARFVWPRVRQVHPDAIWRLAGARPAATVRQLHGHDGIEVIANPDDLDAIRRRAHVAIAPLRAGSGTPIKILEAMADGVPVVTTADGRAGLDALPDDAVAVGTDAEAMAEAVIALLAAPEAAEAQAARARAWLEERHDADTVGRRFEALLESIVAGQGTDS